MPADSIHFVVSLLFSAIAVLLSAKLVVCLLTACFLHGLRRDCTKNNAHDQEIHFHFIELGLDSKLAVTFAKVIYSQYPSIHRVIFMYF